MANNDKLKYLTLTKTKALSLRSGLSSWNRINCFTMGSAEQRPQLRIKVYPETLVKNNKLQILQELRNTNATTLSLSESIKGNIFNQPFPFLTFQRICSSEKLPKKLKSNGDPWIDYFVTLQSFKNDETSSSSGILLQKCSLYLAMFLWQVFSLMRTWIST